MNQTTTMQKLEEMRMSGFTRAYREIMETGRNKDFTTEEIISYLVQAEWDDRYNRRLNRLITRAPVPVPGKHGTNRLCGKKRFR